MAEISLPVHGEKDWGNKLNAAVNAVNDEAEAASEGVGGLEELVTNGRLSESMLERFIIDDGEGRVPDSALPDRLTVQGISQTVNLANQPALDAVAQIPTVITGQIDAKVQPLVAEAIASDSTIAAAGAAAAEAAMLDKDLLEGGQIVEPDLAFAVVDEDGRRTWLEADMGGNPTPYAAQKIVDAVSEGISEELGVLTEMNSEITDLAFAIVDEDDRRTDLEVGQDGKLTDRVVRSIGERLNQSSPPPSAEAEKYKASYEARAHSVVSGPDITCYGDSMTAGAGGEGVPYHAVVGQLTGRTIHARGVGGETSVTITARSGATPLIAIPVGGVIPATPVAADITLLPINGQTPRPLKQGSASFTTGNMLLNNGTRVPGAISRVTAADGTTDVYRFTRATAGEELVADRPMTWLSDDAEARRGDITIIWIGQNGPSNERAIQDAWAIINHLSALDKRWLVINRPTSTDAEDARWHEEFGRRHIAIRKYMVQYGLADAGLTATDTDTADIAAGRIPTSLRIDGVHWNKAGYKILGEQVTNRLKEMGWV